MTAAPPTFTTPCPACGQTVTILAERVCLVPAPWVLEARCIDAPCQCALNRTQVRAFHRAAFTAGYVWVLGVAAANVWRN